MFTTGRLAFIVFFVVTFVVALVWAYGKDRNVNQQHFKRPYLILITIIAIFSALFLFVKLRH
jgi:cytochrome bd-type quinol oxidase subunit 2